METAERGCRVIGNEKPPDGVPGVGFGGAGGMGPGDADERVVSHPPARSPLGG